MSFKDVTNQFKGLQVNDPGAWPLAPKVVGLAFLFGSIVAAAYFFDTQPQLQALDEAKATEESLKKEYVAKYAQAINLELYKAQLKEVDTSFGSLLKQLPDRSNMESLITDINQAGVSQGLAFDLFKPAPQDIRKEFYAELPIALKVNGTYHKIAKFASDIGQLPRIVTLNDISISVAKDGLLSMEAVAKTFRYLDDDEIAAQRKSKAEKRAKAAAEVKQ